MSATNEPTTDEIGKWKNDKLLEWIQQNLTNPLDDEDKEAFFKSKIDGDLFLKGANNGGYFQRASLSFGASEKLAELAGKIIGRKSKSCCLHYPNHATAI